MLNGVIYFENILGLVDGYASSSSYSPEHSPVSENQPQKKPIEDQRTGRWDQQEKARYLSFISTYKNELDSKQFRRSSKIFKLMAIFLKTRAADQCRSHHQKMQKKYSTVLNIIKNYTNELLPEKTSFSDDKAQKIVEKKELIDSIELKVNQKQNQGIIFVEDGDLPASCSFNQEDVELSQYNEIDEVRLFRVSGEDPFEIRY